MRSPSQRLHIHHARRVQLPLELRQRGIHLRKQFIVTHAFLLPLKDERAKGGTSSHLISPLTPPEALPLDSAREFLP